MLKNRENLRIAFMGTPAFSADILEALWNDGYHIAAAFSREDKLIGRKKILEKSPVKIFCEKNHIPVFTPKKIDAQTAKLLQEMEIDLIILVAYGKILPQAVLETPRLGAINIHPSLLPKFRGPSPVQNAILEGETITGSTIMLMDAGVDTGDILRQKEIAIDAQENYVELKKKLSSFSAKLLLETLDDFLTGKIIPQKQDSSLASYCQLITREDGHIHWQEQGLKIFNRFRAFFGWPGIYAIWKDQGKNKRIKLTRISYWDQDFPEKKIGETFLKNETLCVRSGSGTIIIHEMQLEGKISQSAEKFINGYRHFIGTVLE